ncbi:MAG: hypothetical protein H6744_17865 [Deltaproteobacteria bacterium]|nr:hypothetical protein [Deltaproteobacteria bacterium]
MDNRKNITPSTEDTRLAPRRADRRLRESTEERRREESAEHRDTVAEGEDADYDTLVGESEFSARAARGPDADLAREVPVHDRQRTSEGPPRVDTLSESPEDMGARYLERTTEAPRRREPPKDSAGGGRE